VPAAHEASTGAASPALGGGSEATPQDRSDRAPRFSRPTPATTPTAATAAATAQERTQLHDHEAIDLDDLSDAPPGGGEGRATDSLTHMIQLFDATIVDDPT
jgi:hypothetical protein